MVQLTLLCGFVCYVVLQTDTEEYLEKEGKFAPSEKTAELINDISDDMERLYKPPAERRTRCGKLHLIFSYKKDDHFAKTGSGQIQRHAQNSLPAALDVNSHMAAAVIKRIQLPQGDITSRHRTRLYATRPPTSYGTCGCGADCAALDFSI